MVSSILTNDWLIAYNVFYTIRGEVLAEESSEEDDHMHDATYKAIVKVLKENLHKPCQ